MIAMILAVWPTIKIVRDKINSRGIVLIAAVLLGGIAIHHWASSLKEVGRVEIRQQWAEAQKKADAEQLYKIAAQQKQINAADAALVATMAAHVGQIAGLEAALDDKRKTTNAKPIAAAGTARLAACPPIPEGVRNALNAIGTKDR